MIEVERIKAMKGEEAMITLTNESGASVTLSSRGAGIAAVVVPDRDNRLGNVVAAYLPEPAVRWHYEVIGDDEVRFRAVLPNGMGHRREVSYRWTADNVLEVYFQAGDLMDILGQTYFNLDESHEALTDEYLWINSSESPDFSSATQLRAKLDDSGAFAHQWRIRDWQKDVMNDATLLASHRSGRQISVHTSFPTLEMAMLPSGDGIRISTLPAGSPTPLHAPQTTFLHFTRLA